MRRTVALILAFVIGISSVGEAQTPANPSSRGTVAWTIAGAGGGFGIGLWVGLTKFDDSINSDRKVWTTAIVGAAVGAVAGYFFGRSRASRPSPSPSRTAPMLPAEIVWPRNIGAGRNIVASPHGVS
jgi:hypothetical protein